jgi:hypothetical protein
MGVGDLEGSKQTILRTYAYHTLGSFANNEASLGRYFMVRRIRDPSIVYYL